MAIVFSKRRSSERPGFQRRPFWMDGFFSVKALFRRSSFQPLQFRRRMTALHRLDACPVVAGQPNTWWTRLAFFFNGVPLWALGSKCLFGLGLCVGPFVKFFFGP